MRPSIAILIPTKNDEQFIVTTLLSIFQEAAAYRAAGGQIRICVINDGSTDRTPELVRNLGTRCPVPYTLIDRAENRGVTYSLNEGFVATAGGSDLVMRVDADARFIRPGWLDTLVSFLLFDERVGVVAPISIFPDGTIDCHGVEYFPYGRTMILHNHEFWAQPLSIAEVDAVLGVYALMRTEDWEIDTGYYLWREDEDQCLAVRRREKKVFSMGSIPVVHYNRIRKARVEKRVTDSPVPSGFPQEPTSRAADLRQGARLIAAGVTPGFVKKAVRKLVPYKLPPPTASLSGAVWMQSGTLFAEKWGFPNPDPWAYLPPDRRNWTRAQVLEQERSPAGQLLLGRYGRGAQEGQEIVARYLRQRGPQ